MNRVSANTEISLLRREHLECLKLSSVEMNIARLLAWGYTQKEIADRLHRSTLTVQSHMKHIYAELGIHKETDLTRWYLFKEYSINDNPFKKVLAIFFLLLSISMLLGEQGIARVFRSAPLRTVARVIRPARTRRYRNVFYLTLLTA